MTLRFHHKKTCSTCRNAKKFLEERGAKLELVDLDAERLSAQQIDALIGDRDYRKFLNTRNALYRERKMRLHPPTRPEAVALMAEHPNLIKRPLVVAGDEVVLGFDADKLEALARR